jgi:hypothetical protein
MTHGLIRDGVLFLVVHVSDQKRAIAAVRAGNDRPPSQGHLFLDLTDLGQHVLPQDSGLLGVGHGEAALRV